MLLTHYGTVGSMLFWLGVAVCLGAGILFIVGGMGLLALGKMHLHLHDTYYIILKPGYRGLLLAMPLLAGISLMATGMLIKRETAVNQTNADRAALEFEVGE